MTFVDRTPSPPVLAREIRVLGKHGSAYAAAAILNRIIGLLMIPVYTHYLDPTDYGIMELVGLTVDGIGIVVGLGLGESIYRYYYDTDDENKRRLVISTALIGVSLFGLLCLAPIGLLSGKLARLVLSSSDQWPIVAMSLATLWCNQITALIYNYLRVTEDSSRYLVLSTSKLIITLGLNVYFVVGMKTGVIGVFISNLVVSAAFALVVYPMVIRRVGLRFSLPLARNLLRFSLPIVPANLASLLVNTSDRFFVKSYFSLADAGIYALGYKMGSSVSQFVRTPFMQIWAPRSFALYRQKADPELFARITTYFIGTMVLAGLCIAIYIQDAIKILAPPAYWEAASYAPAVALCYVIYALDNQVALGIRFAKRMEYWTYVNVGVSFVNVGLNWAWIPQYGAWGAVGSTGVSVILKVALLYAAGRKFYRIPFEWGRMASMFLVAGILYGLRWSLEFVWTPAGVLVDTGFVLAFLPLVWLCGIFRRSEKEYVRNVVGRLLERALAAWRGR